jgi:S-adenosylmethionine:tRNA ribosyltransferase-isomerase
LRLEDFDYELPADRIAQHPAQPRDSSRLMVLDRASGSIEHRIFRDLPALLSPGDALILNETRVIPARLRARKLPGGGRVELLLLEREGARTWQVLVGGKGLRAGRRLQVEGGPAAEVLAELEGGRRLLRFDRPITPELERLGETPLPPYIHEPVGDPSEYQTVYARRPGSAAAPTAGLHFTPQLLEAVQAAGVRIARITLHIGLDTFAPVKETDPRRHPIHSEWCSVPRQALELVRTAQEGGHRAVAVGTTVVRALETVARAGRGIPGASGDEALRAEASSASAGAAAPAPFEGRTDLFILPGFEFRSVDALLTNFHLPRSTLLMLVSAFAGRERVLAAYEIAQQSGYRFYSFGDAMLIL